MAATNIIELAKTHCKLYKGGDTNPYKPTDYKPTEVTKEKWAEEYLKFQIWEAEYSVIHRFTWWREVWEEQTGKTQVSKEEKAEEVYKLAIRDKLKKMERTDIDFMAMYFKL